MTDGHADLHKQTGLYMTIFALLIVGTVVTVAVAQVDLGAGLNVVAALLIATVKASLVAAIFMHLKWEKAPPLWWILAICAVFFVALMFLPLLTVLDYPPQVKLGTWG